MYISRNQRDFFCQFSVILVVAVLVKGDDAVQYLPKSIKLRGPKRGGEESCSSVLGWTGYQRHVEMDSGRVQG